MFLIIGCSDRQKKLKFSQTGRCKCCGARSEVEVYMVYTCLTLFFIPVFKWNKRYFVHMPCCGADCELGQELGKAVARGRVSHLDTDSLNFTQYGNQHNADTCGKRCPNCGFVSAADFGYCPKCGQRLG